MTPAGSGIVRATARYESWLAGQAELLPDDLEAKHREMATDLFGFFRATFYRWFERWRVVCRDLDGAPVVPSVGDPHVENFGTWRDAEGRLIWGVNDFDEAWPLPYTQDLVRLAASAIVAGESAHLRLAAPEACHAIADGYEAALAGGGAPFVLAEHHAWLRRLATGDLRDPVPYWHAMGRLPPPAGTPPADAVRALLASLPPGSGPPDLRHRVAGAGSLGRLRLVALVKVDGAMVAREAKAVAASACALVQGGRAERAALAAPNAAATQVISRALRVADPFLDIGPRWVLRRLAPDCGRIGLASLPPGRDERRLLSAMGFELGNVHLGDRSAAAGAAKDLGRRPSSWLHDAASAMVGDLRRDWDDWRRSRAR